MRRLLLLLFIPLSIHVLAQTDTTRWPNGQIKTIIKREGNRFIIDCWHANGRSMSSGVFLFSSSLIPLQDVAILDSNGHKLQEYLADKGMLINYFSNGEIKDILTAPINDTAERYVEYYTSRRIKSRKYATKTIGTNGVYFFYPSYSKDIAFMYQQMVNAPYQYEQYYPNGKLYHLQVKSGAPFYYNFTWYLENGMPDTLAYYYRGQSGYEMEKFGRRLEWWNNGRLKSETYYKSNHPDSVQRTWYENGRRQSEAFYTNGSQTGILRTWHENGKLHYYSDYRQYSSGRPSLRFFDNGQMEGLDNDITSIYDRDGNLLYESISLFRYSRVFDFRNGQPNTNTYKGRFTKWRTGKWTAYDSNHNKIYIAHYKNGLLDGEVTLFDEKGRFNTLAHYKEGRLDGEYVALNQSSKDTLAHGYYDFGRKTGHWRHFYETGQLQSVQSYDGNNYNELESYEADGTVLKASKYVDSEKALYLFSYYNKVLYNVTIRYDDGKRYTYLQYHPNGKLADGSWYDTSGGYLKKTYYANGQQQSQAYFARGSMAQGRQFMWYESGQLRLEGEMINGYQEGEWIQYNENGTVKARPYFIKGIEQIKPPVYASCFCNEPAPAIAGPSFFNSAGSYVDLKLINNAMRRFQLDSAYDYVFTGCQHCSPIKLIAVREQKLWIDKKGMYLDLTPCMHGSNETFVKFRWLYTRTSREVYNEFDKDEELLKPLTLADVFDRAMAWYDRRNSFVNYTDILAQLTGDTAFLRKMLVKKYKIQYTYGETPEETENAAFEAAEEQYKASVENNSEAPSFRKHFAGQLAKAVLPYYKKEAALLQKDSTSFAATSSILYQLFETQEPQDDAEKIYGSIEAEMDSGTVALHIPSSFIAMWDTIANKKVLDNNKPVSVPFSIKFSSAKYYSFPNDCFFVPEASEISQCAPAFGIEGTRAWIRPETIAYSLGANNTRRHDEEAAAYSPYDYPAHYKNLHVVFSDMYRKIEADLDEYIQSFMGVVVKEGKMHLPGIASAIPVQNMIMDAQEVNGCIRLQGDAGGFTEYQLRAALEAAGFTVFPRNIALDTDKNATLVLYFRAAAPKNGK